MHEASGAYGARGFAAGPEGAAAGRAGATGHVYQGPMGTTVAHGTAGAQGIVGGEGGIAGGSRVASGTVVKGPEGNIYAHGETASRGFAAGPNGVEGGARVSSGTAVKGADGNVYGRGGSAYRGFAADSNGAVAGHGVDGGADFSTLNGTHDYSATWAHAQGIGAQGWYNDHPSFAQGWSGNQPLAWTPNGWDAAAWGTAALAGAAWPAVDSWLGWGSTQSYPYDYGQYITYQGNDVYYGSQPAGTTEQYYNEASSLADNGAAPPPNDSKWMPLGIFGLLEGNKKTPSITFELAVDKQGVIRGNALIEAFGVTVPVQGAIQRKTQRVCWTVGTNKTTVYDTGLYSLTLHEAPVLVHSGSKSTRQELLVRFKKPPQAGAQDNSLSSN
jgi:hypothetical protein